MSGQDDTFSFQEETLNIADLDAFKSKHGAQDHDVGFKKGWKSEKVSGSEIKERLSALAECATTAVSVHEDKSSQPQSASARPPPANGLQENMHSHLY